VQQDSSGSHVLTDLYKHGHDVTALVRNDDQADIVAARGATPAVVDLYDRAAVVSVLGDADGAIHTASPGDATSADLDSAVVDAAIDAYAGTGKPFIEISGLSVYGANTSITEDSPFQAPALVAWKEPIERRVLAVNDMRGVVVVSSVAYGDGGEGIPSAGSLLPDTAASRSVTLGHSTSTSSVNASRAASLFGRSRPVMVPSFRARLVAGPGAGRGPTGRTAHRGRGWAAAASLGRVRKQGQLPRRARRTRPRRAGRR
jgi:hypothetical protein